MPDDPNQDPSVDSSQATSGQDDNYQEPDPNQPNDGPPADDAAGSPPVPAAPPRKYQPTFTGARLGDDERKQMVADVAAEVGSWDQEAVANAIISRAEDIAERTVSAHMRNYMAVQEKVATTPGDQIKRIAENMLLEQARTNPGIYDDPLAVEGALHAAALRYGYQTGDIRGAMEIIRKPPAGPTKPALKDTPPRADDGKFVPVPSGGGGGGGGNRRHNTNSAESRIRSRFPHLKDSDIAVLMEDRRG